MRTRPLMTLRLSTAPTQNVGARTSWSRASHFPSPAVRSRADRLRGKVLSGGDDWTIKRADGVLELDLRVTLGDRRPRSHPHDVHRHPRRRGAGRSVLRTLPRFETADAKYSFLNRLLAVGTGEITRRRPGSPDRRASLRT